MAFTQHTDLKTFYNSSSNNIQPDNFINTTPIDTNRLNILYNATRLNEFNMYPPINESPAKYQS